MKTVTEPQVTTCDDRICELMIIIDYHMIFMKRKFSPICFIWFKVALTFDGNLVAPALCSYMTVDILTAYKIRDHNL